MAVAAAGMAASMVPCYIQCTDMPLPPIIFQFSPKDGYKLEGEAHVQATGQPATGASTPQYLGLKVPNQVNVKIKLDAFSIPPLPPAVNIAILNQLLMPNPLTSMVGGPKLPTVIYGWGPNIIMGAANVTKVSVQHERFLLGIPIRATADVTLQAIPPPAPLPGTNPTSGGLATRRTHTMVEGDTLASVAYKEYRDPSRWRALAVINKIDDPMRVAPGTELMIPEKREADALVG
jgi:nucleoid-associated protein YgaU